ncbi:hypothetical protein [Candidatus Nanohalobium constans]|uniref:Uncharacterized protein n=1 Tax=Candidatus Nanohalobium constans TaxID=2565781 RepID=A0A5Q0UFU5_9ARCH|nr:hypothetical protein [Candidatus Nanohalobium constans]QGA80261.1 hypothetical protein LC1Nh_0360 [Candidatus Nanohalobium constans]
MKKAIMILALIICVYTATADMEFRSSTPIDVYSQFNMHNNQITNLQNPGADSHALNLGYANEKYLQRNGDSIDGNLDMQNNRILNLPTPASGTDPATKNYVDTQVTSTPQSLSQVLEEENTANQSIDMDQNRIRNLAQPKTSNDSVTLGYANNAYLQRNGDSIDGNLDMKGNSINNIGEITGNNNINNSIQFKSNSINFNQDGAGTILKLQETGQINATNSRITNLKDPSNPQDAATQSYVQSYSKTNDQYIGNNKTHQVGGNINMTDQNITTNTQNRICTGNQC